MFLIALFATFRTLQSRYFLKLLLLSVLATAIAYGLFMGGAALLLHSTSFVTRHWIDAALDWFAGIGIGILAWFLFPAVMPIIANLFQEQIARLIEAREYQLADIPPLPFWPELFFTIRFSALVLLLNLLCLPLYFTTVLFPLVYYPLNAYLLGREFFEMCAARHLGRKAARRFRRSHRVPIVLAGGLLTICANIPVASLFVPFLGVALMVHLYQALATKKKPITFSAVDKI